MTSTRTSQEIDEIIKRWEEEAKARDAFYDTLPAERPCSRHPSVMARLDRDKSPSRGEPLYACPACIQESADAARLQKLRDNGIPEDALHATLDNFDTSRPNVKGDYQSPASFVSAARKFAAGEIRNLILAGSPGIGKGHLAAALCIQHLDAGKSIWWTTCQELFFSVHAGYKDNTADRAVRPCCSRVLLVLDEICLRDLPADGEEILFAIFEARHKARLPSILLSNKPADEVRKWMGARILDRLRSGGVAFRYGEWDSMRGTDKDGSQFEI